MHDPKRYVLSFGSIDDLQHASGIRGREDLRVACQNVLKLSLQQFAGHFRLDQIVDPGAPTTPGAFGNLAKFQIRNRSENLPWLHGDLLSVAQMARLMVCNGFAATRPIRGSRDSNFREPFVNVFELPVPLFRALSIHGIVFQQFRVMF